MNSFILNITASSGEFYQGSCESMVLPVKDGVYGVQAGHSPVLVAIHMGMLKFTVDGETREILVGDGIAEVRKVKEWAKAYQIERMISKDQILELYLNIIFVGGNNNLGVEVGAEYYFNKPAAELDLAESAFLAGINNSPNSYNPYGEKDNSEKIKNRTKTVLAKMKELGKINET